MRQNMGYLVGVALALAASALWAIAPLLYKAGASDDVLDDLFANSLGAFVSALPLLPVVEPPADLHIWIYGALFSALGPLGGTYVFLASLRYADVGLANLFSYSYIVIVALASYFEGTGGAASIAAASLVLLGMALITASGGGVLKGYLLALSSAVLYAASLLFLGMASNYSGPWDLVVVRAMVLFVASSLLIAARRRRPKLSPRIFAAGAISYGIGGPLYIMAVYEAGLAVPTVLTAASPIITEALAAAKLRERPSRRALAGFALASAGLMLASAAGHGGL